MSKLAPINMFVKANEVLPSDFVTAIKSGEWKICPKFLEQSSKTKISTSLADSTQYTSKIMPLKTFSYEYGGYAHNIEGRAIGEYKCAIRCPSVGEHSAESQKIINKNYPASWIDTEKQIPKPHLYLDYMDTRCAEHQGYGREMMKRFYLTSLENGGEGRIACQSSWGSSGFYEKLGFELGEGKIESLKKEYQIAKAQLEYAKKNNDTQFLEDTQYLIQLYEDILLHGQVSKLGDCYLYFTPTEENLAKLFKKIVTYEA